MNTSQYCRRIRILGGKNGGWGHGCTFCCAVKSVIHSFAPLELPSLLVYPPFIFRNHASMHTILASFLHLNFLPLSSRDISIYFFFFAICFKESGEETWNMYQISPPFFFRIFLLIVSFFNRMLRVIFLHKFIWNWKLQQMPRKNDTDRHGSPIIRSRVINLTKHMPQHHAKPMPCIISLYLSFPTCNLHSTVPSFFPILIPYSRQISSRSLSTPLSLRRCNVVVLAPV